MIKFEWIDSKVKFLGAVLVVIIGLITIYSKINFFHTEILEEDVSALLKNRDSFVKNNDIEGLSGLFHPEFTIDITHPNGRVESLNLDQYRSHFDMISNLPFSMSYENLATQITRINKNMVLVTQITSRTPHGSSEIFSQLNTNQFQSTVIVMDNGKLKFIKISSITIDS